MALTNVVDFYSTPASAKTGMRSRYVTQSNGVVVRKSSIRKLPNDKVESILQTLQSLQNDVTNCNSRLALFESRFEQQKTALERDCITDYDAIFLLGSEDIALDSVIEEGAIKPSNEAELPTNEAIKPPNKANKPPNEVTKPQVQMRTPKGHVMTPTLLSHPGNPPRIFLILGKEFPSVTKL